MVAENHSIIGTHILADFYDVKDSALLNNEEGCLKLCKKAIETSGAELISIHGKKFEPQGVTVVSILAESSLDLHTYPEHGHMSLSFHTCGEKADPLLGIKYIIDILNIKNYNILKIKRGEQQGFNFERIYRIF